MTHATAGNPVRDVRRGFPRLWPERKGVVRVVESTYTGAWKHHASLSPPSGSPV
jgi:hypothetical protein